MTVSNKRASKSKGRKRRPLNPEWKRWDKECKTTRHTIKGFKESKGLGIEKWRDGMIRHYKGHLAKLKEIEPPKYLED